MVDTAVTGLATLGKAQTTAHYRKPAKHTAACATGGIR